MWVHALAVLIGVELHTRNVEKLWEWLRKPLVRKVTEQRDAPLLSLATPPPEPPAPLPEAELERWLNWGAPEGKGLSIQEAVGQRPQEAMLHEKAEQAMMSRDREGPAVNRITESDALRPPGQGGMPGLRPGVPGPGGAGALSAQPSQNALPFGVSPPPTAPKVLRRRPVPVADVAPAPLPTPVERRPVIEIVENGKGVPRPLLTQEPTTRPTDRLATVVQTEPHPAAEPDVRGRPSTRQALVYDSEREPTQAPAGRRANPLAVATRPSDLIDDRAEPLADLPAEAKGRPLPATRATEGQEVASAKPAEQELAAGPDAAERRMTRPGPVGREAEGAGAAQARLAAEVGPGGDPLAGAAGGGAVRPPADQAPESESEADAFSKDGGVSVVAGRVEARLGRRVKTVAPDIRLKGGMDVLTSLADPSLLLRADFDQAGKVTLVTVMRSSGSRDVDRATVLAVYRWWFEPEPGKDGKPKGGFQEFPVRYRTR
jgi:TonB family protein